MPLLIVKCSSSATDVCSGAAQVPLLKEPSGRLALKQAVGRLLVMSWNPGGGCHSLVSVLETVGYHVVCIQEAAPEQLSQLDGQKWSPQIMFGLGQKGF